MMTMEYNTTALSTLSSILEDSNYFPPQGKCAISPSMLPQLQTALAEAEGLIIPILPERLHQLLTRLFMHFPLLQPEMQQCLMINYIQTLKEYPEDLLCAAYHHVSRHHEHQTIPKLADIVAFIEPEFVFRHEQKRKIETLIRKIENLEA